jgi:hypothetical protein
MPGNRPGDVEYFAAKREEIRRALEAADRDPDAFTFAAQVDCGVSREQRVTALAVARRFLEAGASHVILGVPASAGPEGMAAMARDVAEPLADA